MIENVSIRLGDTIQLQIEKLLYGGNGLAHHGSRACFVKNVIPGETVFVRVEEVKKHYLITSPVKFLTSSSSRIKPVCPLFLCCGGCQWQHIDYEHQIYWKTNIVEECFSRIAGIKDIIIKSPIPSPLVFNYRTKANLKICFEREPIIGYFRKESHEIIPVRNCNLLAQPLNDALVKCWDLLQSENLLMKHFEALHLILINQSNQVICLVKARNKDKNIKLLFQNKSMKFIKNKETANEEIMGMYFKRDTASFYQINYLQNIEMISLVLKYFSPQIQDKILDLFCGCGNFSLFLAREGADIIGVDSNAFAVNEAKHNARLNNIQNCHFMTADVDTISSHLLNDRFHGVLLNPPRSGCSQRILKEIGYANPETIVYVSCNPTTLARDLRVLINSSYLLEDVQPIDLFPQTYHIETVVKLKRK